MELTTIHLAATTTPLETMKFSIAMTGAAPKTTPTVKENAIPITDNYLTDMDQLITTTTMMNQYITQKFAATDKDVVMMEKLTSLTSPPTNHSAASSTQS